MTAQDASRKAREQSERTIEPVLVALHESGEYHAIAESAYDEDQQCGRFYCDEREIYAVYAGGILIA